MEKFLIAKQKCLQKEVKENLNIYLLLTCMYVSLLAPNDNQLKTSMSGLEQVPCTPDPEASLTFPLEHPE